LLALFASSFSPWTYEIPGTAHTDRINPGLR